MAGKTKAERKKRRRAAKREVNAPLEHQKQTGVEPLEAVTVKHKKTEIVVNGKPRYIDEHIVSTVRRQADARLWEHIEGEPIREAALYDITGAWRSITNGVGVRTFDPTKTPGRGDAAASAEFNMDLRAAYRDWVEMAKNRGIDHQVIIDLFCHAISARVVETTARRRHGWAIEEMIRGLELWAEIRKWKRKVA